MQFGKVNLWVALSAVAAVLSGCESSDDASGAYWNQQGSTSNTSDPTDNPSSTNTTSTSSSTTTSGTAVAADAIDPSTIHYLSANVSSWPVTSSLKVSLGSTVTLAYDKANVWPAVDGVNANPWIIVNVNGKWTAATFEWFRKGQTSKPSSVVAGDHIKKSPLNNFRPVSGETYGWMVTSLARDAKRTVNERTNIVLATWP